MTSLLILGGILKFLRDEYLSWKAKEAIRVVAVKAQAETAKLNKKADVILHQTNGGLKDAVKVAVAEAAEKHLGVADKLTQQEREIMEMTTALREMIRKAKDDGHFDPNSTIVKDAEAILERKSQSDSGVIFMPVPQ